MPSSRARNNSNSSLGLLLPLGGQDLVEDGEGAVHGLVVEEDDVELVHVVGHPLLEVDVEEADLEHVGGVVDAVGHAEVAERVADKDDVVAALQLLGGKVA